MPHARADAATEPRTNIILILADDLGYGDVGFQGSKQIPTPNLDRLAASGVVCAQGYVSAPVCSPSRAGLLTGRNQVEFGYDNNLSNTQPGFDPDYNGLPVTERTMADRLHTAGYVTGLIGKWHLGDRPQFHPLRRGFDEFWGFLGGGHRYFPAVPGRPEPDIECNFGPVGAITYLTDNITDQSIAFIQRHRAHPFFLYVAYNAPHAPMNAREEDLGRFAFIPDKNRRTYCAMVARLDDQIGRLLDAVQAAGLAEKTLLVFLSDNGGPVDQNASLNAPLNGQKGMLLEGGMRVPFVFSWPGRLPAGKIYDQVISSLDLTPTFLRLAGAAEPQFAGLAGTDLMAHLTGRDNSAPHHELKWRFTVSAAIRDGDWKLVRLPDRLPLLFNLRSDISEQHDVALQNLERTKTLLARLGDWDVRLPHPVTLEGAEWKRRQLNLYDAQFPLVQPVGSEVPRMVSTKETTSPH
ncbi:MAG: sulfatase-like hydrolase/transferase [Lacunisphaera sp.]|nr:sulfatase-like hydrolase/transferase [Lacunisphaera sp.]